MKLSMRARRAVWLMLEVAGRPDAPTSLREVAERTRISRRSLDQIALGLGKANLLRGRSGHGGGYRLARAPAQISVGEIIEAATGPLDIVECVRHPELCLRSELCECRVVYALMNERILELLHGMSLAEMAEMTGRAAMELRARPARDISSHGEGAPRKPASAR